MHENVGCVFEDVVGGDAIEVGGQDAKEGVFGCSDAVANPRLGGSGCVWRGR